MVRAADVEHRVLQRLDRAKAGAPIEDTSIELKEKWPEYAKAARRLAAHANCAGGDPITWLIGAKEDGTVVGAGKDDLATVVPSIAACFEANFAPEVLRADVIPYDSSTVLAVTFATDRAPYVVVRPDGFDVPWREGTRTRSAKRHELLRMLVPTMAMPAWEPERLSFLVDEAGGWLVSMVVELVPAGSELVMLSRRSELAVEVNGRALSRLTDVSFGSDRHNRTRNLAEFLSTGARCYGPVIIEIGARFESSGGILNDVRHARAAASVRIANSTRPLVMDAEFHYPNTWGPPSSGNVGELGLVPMRRG